MAIKAIADAIPKLAIQGKQFALPESFIGWPAREKKGYTNKIQNQFNVYNSKTLK